MFFFEFAKEKHIRESFAKVGYYESLQLVKGYHLLPPWGSGRRMAPLSKVRLRHSQIPWS
jgi:hypothetical protein